MICNELQDVIATRYDLALPCQVQDFICHDQQLVAQITGTATTGSEALLVSEASDTLDVTLFLEEHLLDSLTDTADYKSEGGNFDDYCTVLEGVSHFVYLVWNAQYGRQIKPVEMELQAEVDKFVFAADQRGSLKTAESEPSVQKHTEKNMLDKLTVKLFRNIRYLAQEDAAITDRYRTANALAEIYCGYLAKHYRFKGTDPLLTAELARFYRMNGAQKFDYIRHVSDV